MTLMQRSRRNKNHPFCVLFTRDFGELAVKAEVCVSFFRMTRLLSTFILLTGRRPHFQVSLNVPKNNNIKKNTVAVADFYWLIDLQINSLMYWFS